MGVHGSKFWQARSSHGRNPIFGSPEELWACCCQYFEWTDENPLYENRPFSLNGEIIIKQIPKMRAMTKQGMCLFLEITLQTWENYKVKDDFFDITRKVEQIIYDQKFSGAAAELLNANIIARDLGLSDKKDMDITSGGKQMVTHIILTSEDDDSKD